MNIRIDGRARRMNDSPLGNEDVSDSTISVEDGDVIVSDGPVTFEIVPDDE